MIKLDERTVANLDVRRFDESYLMAANTKCEARRPKIDAFGEKKAKSL